MNGIASLLDVPAASRVEQLWQELEARCSLVGVKITPFPHLTWQVTEAYDLSRLDHVLHSLALQTQPFTIHTSGLGLFTSETPIVYISIVNDEPLMQFHARLWDKVKGIAIHPMLYYAPGQWVPHITLAYRDVTPSNLDCVMQGLAFQALNWEIRIDNLILVAQGEGQNVETIRYPFGR
jgi:2'-5' RNA ligase